MGVHLHHHHHDDEDTEHEHHHSIASLRSKFESLAQGHHSIRPSVRPNSPGNGSSAAASPVPSSAPPSRPTTSASSSTGSLPDVVKRAPPSSFRPPPSLAPKPQLRPSRPLDPSSLRRSPSPTSPVAASFPAQTAPSQSFTTSVPPAPTTPSGLRATRPSVPAEPPETGRAALTSSPEHPRRVLPKPVPQANVRQATLEGDTQPAAEVESDAPVSVTALRQRFGQATGSSTVRTQRSASPEPVVRSPLPTGNGTVEVESVQATSARSRMAPPEVPAKPAPKVAVESAPLSQQSPASHAKGPAPPPPQSRGTSRPASRTASPIPEIALAPATSTVRSTSSSLSSRPPPPPPPQTMSPAPLAIPAQSRLPPSLPMSSSPQAYSFEPDSHGSTPPSNPRGASPRPLLISTSGSRRPAPPRPVSPQPVVPTEGTVAPTASSSTPSKPPLPVRKATLPAGLIDAPPPLPTNKPPPPQRSATMMSSSSSESSIFKPPLPGNKPSAPTVVPMAEQRPALPQRPRGDSVSGVTIPTSGTPPPRRPARQATVHSVPTSAYSSPPPSHRQRGASISVEPGYDPPPPPPLRTAGHSSAAGLGRANTVSAASRLDVRRMNGGSASPGRTTSGADSDYDEDEGPAPALSSTAQRLLEEHPDSTYANKTAPVYGKRSTTVRPPHSITSFAVYSQYVAVGHSHVLVYDVTKSNDPILDMDQKEDTGFELRVKEPRITALGFRPSRDPTCEGRYLWCGNKDGHLWEIDIEFGRVTATKPGAHSSAVSHIMRHEYYILTLDDTGKLNVWEVPEPCDKGEAGNFRLFRTMRVSDRVTFAKMIKGKLWTATAPTVRSATTTAGVRGPTVRVYEPFVLGNAPPPRTNLTPEWTGSATSATVVPFKSDLVYIGHEGGFVSLWQLAGTELHCVQVLKVSTTDILALEGVGDHLWAGNRRGQIHVWNIDQQPWTTSNLWTVAKDDPIRALLVDPRAIPLQKRLPLWSVTRDTMSSWDGLRAVNWIEKRMIERQPDYCTFRDVKVLVVSWNIDSAKPSDLSSGGIDNVNFLSQVLGSVESPDIVVFGFQEVVPLTDKKLTAKTLLFGSKGKDGGGATNERVSGAYRAWADKLTSAIQLNIPGAEYMKLHSEQLVGLFTCVFTKNEEMLQQTIKDVVITTVKRGIGGIYGNKGAIVARMVLDDTSLCFINVHLAAGQRHKAARNADLAAIMENKDIFPKSAPQWFVHGGNGEAILDHEMVVLNGDLNYRIDQRRQVVESSILSGDLNYLLEYDQLRAEMRGNHAFRLRTFAEAPITFAPTYKYDPGTNEYDSSEKRRIPAWCDRVLFTKSPRISSISYRRYEVNVSDHRPVSAGLVCQVKSIDPVRCAIVRSEIEAAWKVYQEERLETMAKTYAGWY